ncbi:14680_t:CDS:2 [Funneliformis geosporum]|nr:14680_t:CDS:2 [Funneliformis geosporum]
MVEWKSTLQWKKCKYSSFVRVQSPFLREVIVRGDITGLDYDEMSECIKAITKFNFVHVQKKEDKEKASQFYYNMMKKRFYYDDNKERGLIHFYDATYYNSTQKVVYKMDTETANTGTSTSVLSRVEISDHNNINENERSKKRKITEKRKSPESPVSVVYVLYEDNEKTVPGKSIKNFLPIGPFKAEVELPSGIKTISVKIEIEHGVSTVTLEKSKKVFEII